MTTEDLIAAAYEQGKRDAVPEVALLKEVHLINDTYKAIRATRQFAIDDIEYDLFSAGWKACADLIAAAPKQER